MSSFDFMVCGFTIHPFYRDKTVAIAIATCIAYAYERSSLPSHKLSTSWSRLKR